MKQTSMPLALGTIVEPYGEIGAVMVTGGERYYLIKDGFGVALMPADVIEGSHEEQ